MQKAALLILTILLTGNGHTEEANSGGGRVQQLGNTLLALCEAADVVRSATNVTQLGVCYGYLQGVADSVTSNRMVLQSAKEAPEYVDYFTHEDICKPNNITVGQLHKVFVKTANENPEALHIDAYNLVLFTFAKAWPCK